MEELETRTLLAASALFLGGELQILTDADEDVIVRANPNSTTSVQVLVNNTPLVNLPGLTTAQVTSLLIVTGDESNDVNLGGVTLLAFPNLTSIVVDTGNGDDSIIGSPDWPDSIDAGDGKDTINGQGGDDILNAGDGDDSILGGAGDDSIDANDGNDFVNGEAGDDTILAGDGNDNVLGGTGDDSITNS